MKKLIVLDFDGTMINGSIENDFSKYIFGELNISNKFIFIILGFTTTCINWLLKIAFIPPVLAVWQRYTTPEIFQEFIKLQKDKPYKLNPIIIEEIRILLNESEHDNFHVAIVTGSPEIIVKELFSADLKKYFPNMTIMGSDLNPGNFNRKSHLYGWSKIKIIKEKFPQSSFKYHSAYGNSISDAIQTFYFNKFHYVQLK